MIALALDQAATLQAGWAHVMPASLRNVKDSLEVMGKLLSYDQELQIQALKIVFGRNVRQDCVQ